SQLIAIASNLYSGGIRDIGIWERAGGRVADITISLNGRAQWQEAIRHVRNGGRGASFAKLLDEMLEDFPDNEELSLLRG
ncbi:effector-associated domain EAD1-containing protein, partial [Hymenobacter defluvii]